MRRVLLATSLVMCFIQLYGQLNRGQIKRNNKKIQKYRGRDEFKNRYWGMGISFNAMNYYGDLAPIPSKFSTDFAFTKPSVSAVVYHRFGPRYTLLGQFTYGTLEGSDAKSANRDDLSNGVFRYKRNLSFRNKIEEFSVVAVFDLFENYGKYFSRVSWTPYAFVGVAAFHHNPQGIAPAKFLDGTPNPYAGQWVDLQPLGTEGQYTPGSPLKPYSLFQFAVPIGMGARFRLNEVLDIWADIGFRFTSTGYLDDVRHDYVDLSKIQSKSDDPITNKLAAAMSYRTNEVLGEPDASTSGAHYYNATANSGAFYTWPGYGSEGKDNWRGRAKNRDVYVVTSLKITYILGATMHRAKFR